MKNLSTRSVIRILITVVAILNLIALFFFNYHLSGIPNAPSGYQSVYLSSPDVSENSEVSTENPSKADKERPSDYEGPSISLSKDLPEIAQEDLDRLPQVLRDLDLLSADDGAGKNISSGITCSYRHAEGRNFDVEFQVKNSYGDTATESGSITVAMTKPMILLKSDHADLTKGDSFDAKDYLEEAIDTDGKDITRYVVTSGNVKTKIAGTYEVEYSVTSQENDSLNTAKLTVIVQ